MGQDLLLFRFVRVLFFVDVCHMRCCCRRRCRCQCRCWFHSSSYRIKRALVMFPEYTMGVFDVHSFGTLLPCRSVEEGRNVRSAPKNENRSRAKIMRTENWSRGVRSIGWSFPEYTMGVFDVHSFGTIVPHLPVEEGRNFRSAPKNENWLREPIDWDVNSSELIEIDGYPPCRDIF